MNVHKFISTITDKYGEYGPVYCGVVGSYGTHDDAEVNCQDCKRILAIIERGQEHGKAKGSWIIDGNTTIEATTRILKGIRDGDPEVMDLCPSPLSGEQAGESIPELLDGIENWTDDDLEFYEAAFTESFWNEVIEHAAVVIGDES